MSEEKDGKPKRSRLAALVSPLWNVGAPVDGSDSAGPDLGSEDVQSEPLPPGTASPESVEKLRRVVGLDDPASAYRQFSVIENSLVGPIPDPKARYKAAMDVATKTQVITSDLVLSEFVQQRERLEAEGKRREDELDALMTKKVDPKRTALAQVRALAEAARTELEQLKAKDVELEAALMSEESAFRGIAADLGAALDSVKAEIDNAEKLFRGNLGIS